MKKTIQMITVVLVLAAAVYVGLSRQNKEWVGVDESVVEKFAAEAGRPARPPFINTDQGDLLLFLFLVAGATGGFIAGYYFRQLFPPAKEKAPHV